jgi:dienelactone hydrolase
VSKGALLPLVFLSIASIVWPPAERIVRAARVLLDVSGKVAAPGSAGLIERNLSLPGRDGPIRARIYRRANGARGPGIVVLHGVHYRGIDEGRLVPFARALAHAGLVVLTPELKDLADYRVTGRGLGVIEDSVRYFRRRSDLLSRRRVGLLGFSFAGGLALLAAERPEMRGKLAYVTSVGGYDDLERVLHFLVENRVATPSGERELKANEYGLAVLVYDHLDRFVPAADRQTLRAAFRAWLHEDRPRAWRIAAGRRTLAGERLFEELASGNLDELRPELERAIAEQHAELRALSPRGHFQEIRVPVYLLHGEGDNVIPPSESRWAARELDNQPHVLLVSPLIQHVALDHRSEFWDDLRLVAFVAHLFS